MQTSTTYLTIVLALGTADLGLAHDLGAPGGVHPHDDWPAKPPAFFFAQADGGQPRSQPAARPEGAGRPAQADVFEAFAPKVSVRWDDRFLIVENNGIPSHNMMVGISNWQQQVPLPQSYTGANAWLIPLSPVPAKEPASVKNRFLRGAIAVAANGIPIFNPQNNRGEVSQEIGELDQWGGHCGRADDYHYHSAPLHLQAVVGKGRPIAYALDGYAIFGLTEPDGSQPAGLDDFNGHTAAGLGYHYHASTKYPYVNGGFHGEVIERGGQVDPQPRAQPLRRDLPPLRGATITAFESSGGACKLTYEIGGDKRAILYSVNADGSAAFEYQNGSAGTTRETYTRREGGGGGGPRPERAAAGKGAAAMDALKKPNASFVLTSPEVSDGGKLPADYTGDGTGSTPPLTWKGAPAGTQSYALIMDHLAPGGDIKSYWTMWDIPAEVTGLEKNAKGVGKLGTGFKGGIGYEPPHSQGPGAKVYVLTVYALSAPVPLDLSQPRVNRENLLAAMAGKVLASASLNVVYSREGAAGRQRGEAKPVSRQGDRPR